MCLGFSFLSHYRKCRKLFFASSQLPSDRINPWHCLRWHMVGNTLWSSVVFLLWQLILSSSYDSFEHIQDIAYYLLFLGMLGKCRVVTDRVKSSSRESLGSRSDPHVTSSKPSLPCLQRSDCHHLTPEGCNKRCSPEIGRGQQLTAPGWKALEVILPQVAITNAWAEVTTSILVSFLIYLLLLSWGLGPLAHSLALPGTQLQSDLMLYLMNSIYLSSVCMSTGSLFSCQLHSS